MVVMFAVVVVGASITVFLTRYEALSGLQRADGARRQALTLASTACAAGVTGTRDVSTRFGAARVSRVSASTVVQLGATRVQLDCATGALTR